MLNKHVVIAGYSGHGLVVAEAAIKAGINLTKYSELNEIDFNPFNLKYLGFEGDNEFSWNMFDKCILGIGDNYIRRKTAENLLRKNKTLLNVIHPDSSISEIFNLGVGNFVSRNVSVNVGSKIADGCIINTGAVIEHECILNDFVHIAPGAVLAGNVIVGQNSFIGANSVIKQGVTIGSNVIIGAGAVVVKNIPDNKKVVGNPARELI